MTEQKPDVVLTDGKKIVLDKRNIKRWEWTRLFASDQTLEESEEILARFSGTDAQYIHNLSMYDYQLLLTAAADVVRRPVDPNLPGEPI